MNPDDTIVAISSAPGAAPRGVVRLSGPAAVSIASGIFECRGGSLCDRVENCHVQGELKLGRRRISGGVYLFRAPRSYTRQDMVELHLIGSPPVLGWVVEACLSAGARRAEPGEFTARAFLAGAMDLSAAHGIAGMIAARSDMQLRAAERLLHGALATTAGHAREELADLLSLVEGALDFADEPIEFITPRELSDRLKRVRDSLAATASAGLRGQRWDRLPKVALVGRPNAGKSSLMNRLTGMDRAICASIAGTTRDVLSAPMVVGETECLLIDAAGLQETSDTLDRRAQDAARRAVEAADVIVHVVDLSDIDGGAMNVEWGERPVIRAGNKCDVVPNIGWNEQCDVRVSAVTGQGLDDLKQAIGRSLQDRESDAGEDAIALMAEHREALEASIAAMDRAMALVQASGESLDDADLVAAELHIAADELATLVGKDQTEELLGRIFSRFCVGK